MLPLQHGIRKDHPVIPGDKGLSLLGMVIGKIFRGDCSETNSLETKGKSCHNPDGVTCARHTKVTKARKF
jgi:hypothetical protein